MVSHTVWQTLTTHVSAKFRTELLYFLASKWAGAGRPAPCPKLLLRVIAPVLPRGMASLADWCG